MEGDLSNRVHIHPRVFSLAGAKSVELKNCGYAGASSHFIVCMKILQLSKNNLHRISGRFGHVRNGRHGFVMTESDVKCRFEGRLIPTR